MVSSSKCTLWKNLLLVVRSWSELVSLGWGRSLPRPSSDRARDETGHSAWKTSGRYSQWWHHTHPGMFLWYLKSRLRLSLSQKGTIPHCFKMLWWPHCEVLLIFMEQVEFWHPSSKYGSDLFTLKTISRTCFLWWFVFRKQLCIFFFFDKALPSSTKIQVICLFFGSNVGRLHRWTSHVWN